MFAKFLDLPLGPRYSIGINFPMVIQHMMEEILMDCPPRSSISCIAETRANQNTTEVLILLYLTHGQRSYFTARVSALFVPSLQSTFQHNHHPTGVSCRVWSGGKHRVSWSARVHHHLHAVMLLCFLLMQFSLLIILLFLWLVVVAAIIPREIIHQSSSTMNHHELIFNKL